MSLRSKLSHQQETNISAQGTKDSADWEEELWWAWGALGPDFQLNRSSLIGDSSATSGTERGCAVYTRRRWNSTEFNQAEAISQLL